MDLIWSGDERLHEANVYSFITGPWVDLGQTNAGLTALEYGILKVQGLISRVLRTLPAGEEHVGLYLPSSAPLNTRLRRLEIIS